MTVIPKSVYCRKRQTAGKGGFSVFGRQTQFEGAENLAVVDVGEVQFDAILAGLKRESAEGIDQHIGDSAHGTFQGRRASFGLRITAKFGKRQSVAQGLRIPLSKPRATAAARSEAWSFSLMWPMWAREVRSETPNNRPISSLVKPWRTNSRTSISRVVR